ncbi:spermidine/putrescine ABC transporter ATP-binding protein [Bacillus toyonensis]|nr:spermidine/putrescine ABC transporter ATP-binding protein [Bacillus toyonensis]
MYNRDTRFFYPALMGSKIPAQNSAKAKKLGGRSTARKSPIGEG